MTHDEIREAERLFDKAHKEISDLCTHKQWRMCVPVQDDDSDILLSKAIDTGQTAIAEVKRLQAENEQHRKDWAEVRASFEHRERMEAVCRAAKNWQEGKLDPMVAWQELDDAVDALGGKGEG